MRVSVLSSGTKPCRLLPLKKRIVVSRAYGSAPEESEPSLLPATSEAPEVGAELREWLASPFDFAAFGPRLTVGALLSAPEKLSSLQTEIEEARDIINSPAPPEDKSKLLAAKFERLTTEALEKGAGVEADILEQVKVYLPEDVATRITTPETPVSKAKPTPVVTELPDDIEFSKAKPTPVVTELPDDIELN